jgi:beta-1,4-N-acetylglucosaminyltransferase
MSAEQRVEVSLPLKTVDPSEGIRIGNVFIYYRLIYLLVLCCVIIPYSRIFYLIFLRPTNGLFGWLWNTHRTKPSKTFIVLGSGGHTAEMLKLLSGVSLTRYSPRTYIVAENDKLSKAKAEAFESSAGGTGSANIKCIPRAREVGQSYFSSVFTTLYSILASMWLVVWNRPDLLLCNGPGTCVPICFWAFICKYLFIKDVKIVYVESFCRVKYLSLSGQMVYYIVDSFLVHWPQLKAKYPRTTFIGRLM